MNYDALGHYITSSPLTYDLPTNTTIPNNLREDFIPTRHIRRCERLAIFANEQNVLTGARTGYTIDLVGTDSRSQ